MTSAPYKPKAGSVEQAAGALWVLLMLLVLQLQLMQTAMTVVGRCCLLIVLGAILLIVLFLLLPKLDPAIAAAKIARRGHGGAKTG